MRETNRDYPDLEAIEAMVNDITEWTHLFAGQCCHLDCLESSDLTDSIHNIKRPEDAAFIANHSRNIIRSLIAEVRRLRQQVEERDQWFIDNRPSPPPEENNSSTKDVEQLAADAKQRWNRLLEMLEQFEEEELSHLSGRGGFAPYFVIRGVPLNLPNMSSEDFDNLLKDYGV